MTLDPRATGKCTVGNEEPLTGSSHNSDMNGLGRRTPEQGGRVATIMVALRQGEQEVLASKANQVSPSVLLLRLYANTVQILKAVPFACISFRWAKTILHDPSSLIAILFAQECTIVAGGVEEGRGKSVPSVADVGLVRSAGAGSGGSRKDEFLPC